MLDQNPRSIQRCTLDVEDLLEKLKMRGGKVTPTQLAPITCWIVGVGQQRAIQLSLLFSSLVLSSHKHLFHFTALGIQAVA